MGIPEHDMTQDFNRLESDIKEQMSTIATQVRESILGLSEQMTSRFQDLDSQVRRLESRIREQDMQPSTTNTVHCNENTNSMQKFGLPARNHSQDSGDNSLTHDANIVPQLNSNVPSSQSSINEISQSKGDNHYRLKPQTFSGNEDFEDFLAHFQITVEINGWDYRAKLLHLANCLSGPARSLLSELTSEQRRDYNSLVQKLTARFRSENRAEVFRAQLKSRVKGNSESIPELAQSVSKLVRQSYPKASLDVIETLALDHYIDALTETEIRLRLREVGPKTLSEAETFAVRMDAHRIADKQRTRLVGKVEKGRSNSSPDQSCL